MGAKNYFVLPMTTRTFTVLPITRLQIRIRLLAMQMGVSSSKSSWSKIKNGRCVLISSWNMDSIFKNQARDLAVLDKRALLRQALHLLRNRSLKVTLMNGRHAGKIVALILPLPITTCTAPTGRLSMIWEL